jgi:hypothetical protein
MLYESYSKNPANATKAIETELHVLDAAIGYEHPRRNLAMMFKEAAAAGSADTVDYLLAFAKSHDIPYGTLINRESINPAICSANSIAVFEKMLTVRPESVGYYMSHAGTPLTQAIIGRMKAPLYTSERTLLTRFLLKNGADPNRVSPPHSKGPGVYLQNACGHASLEVVELPLQHGAQIRQSRAMYEAGEKGRIVVLVMLLEHGADINEQLWKNDSMYSSKYRAKLKKKSGLVIDIGDSAGRLLEYVGSGTEQT